MRAALAQAETYAINSRSYMAANTLLDRYTWWFGPVSTANASKVLANFTAIADAFANKPITVDCGCKKTYYAYVFPNQPYISPVGKAFWTAPLAGTGSHGGTQFAYTKLTPPTKQRLDNRGVMLTCRENHE